MVWWHTRVLRHRVRVSRVSVPLWDPSSRGELIKCSCGKVWAK
jgi:hypothetical protein